MSASSATTGTRGPRPPLWRDVRVLRVLGQIAFAALTVAFLWWIWGNLTGNLEQRNLPTGFDYLSQPGGFIVQYSDVTSSTPIWQVILTGVENTLRVSLVGIVLATVIGVLIGIGRLSSNWLVRKASALYVESVRNIPVLVWIIFFFSAVLLPVLPQVQNSQVGNLFVANNRAVSLAGPTTPEGGAGTLWLLALAALLAAVAVGWWRTRRNIRTGEPHHRVIWGVATFAVIFAIGFVIAGVDIGLDRPARDGFSVTGGFALTTPFLGVLIGLVVYTASHIAEIVRGSILAVPKGQQEAAQAIALTGFQRMRYVILPQALRIMVPPTANQYLNLTKNSSLAIAIGYSDLMTVVKTIIGNGRPAPQNIAIAMAIYLTISLTISFFTNLYNRRIQYVGRT
ncbi:MAG: ABC transporter permease subunit [Nitriliruptorales bacterium]|nr:ABC transporter permease subunit [Nitriliruptorales bacterium]